jgi:hypothetical protein
MGKVILLPESFCPSPVFLDLVYSKLHRALPEVKNNISVLTRENARYSFVYTLDAIREWRICPDFPYKLEYLIVHRDCTIREEFLAEMMKRIDFHKDAEPDKLEVTLRIGEDIMAWAIREPEEAKRHHLKIDKGNLILVRKQQIDNTGCA